MRKGRKKRDDMEGMNWDEERDVAVRVLLKFVQLHIEKLWEPPIVEEAFVKYVQY